MGLEGLIGKRLGSKYEAGKRSGTWIKLKLYQEKNTLSADTPNRMGLGSILVRCWWAYVKRSDSSSLAELCHDGPSRSTVFSG